MLAAAARPDQLEGDPASELGIARGVRLAHAAPADQHVDDIAIDAIALDDRCVGASRCVVRARRDGGRAWLPGVGLDRVSPAVRGL
jgi:hypothetical protein